MRKNKTNKETKKYADLELDQRINNLKNQIFIHVLSFLLHNFIIYKCFRPHILQMVLEGLT
jgi:hypothetical protein